MQLREEQEIPGKHRSVSFNGVAILTFFRGFFYVMMMRHYRSAFTLHCLFSLSPTPQCRDNYSGLSLKQLHATCRSVPTLLDVLLFIIIDNFQIIRIMFIKKSFTIDLNSDFETGEHHGGLHPECVQERVEEQHHQHSVGQRDCSRGRCLCAEAH